MKMKRGLVSLVVGFGVVIGGCVGSPESPEVEEAAQHISGGTGSMLTCSDPLVCGFNSPEIDNMGFHELEMTGATTNSQGFRLLGLWQQGVRYDLHVVNSKLSGTYPDAAIPPISGKNLIGAEIRITYSPPFTERELPYVIRVVDVRSMYFPALPGGTGPGPVIETYILDYASMYGGNPSWKNICTLHYGGSVPDDERFGQDLKESILFEGDRVDMARLTMNAEPAWNWFNIGCAGHTLAKLYLTRNTIASQLLPQPWYQTQQPARQATLKLLTADYCGSGRPFTVAGQKLVWKGGAMGDYMRQPANLEARWDQNGARCLGTTRMTRPTTEEGKRLYPDARALEVEIQGECELARHKLPPCSNAKPKDFDGALRMSGNY